ncbi:hypothetical protein RJ640_024568 [Escallonia rubra]|uniref:H15 domain-containing protein n=1 Tax=Escallonia rubra TaxID=112253 RepID=A0AA88US88_9ASTE|nr:hypothetical protein RJ640_024568 [Escallonia rubra]
MEVQVLLMVWRSSGGGRLWMIFAAIDAPKEKEGSNKSSISQYIESTYGDLPAEPPNLLSDNLNKTKEAGESAMVKNNYLRPDPSLDSWAGSGSWRCITGCRRCNRAATPRWASGKGG